jgi:hypothetical protein
MRLPQLQCPSFPVSFTRLVLIGLAMALVVMPPRAAARSPQAANPLALSPATLRFGAVELGQSETQLVTVTNNGQSSVTITQISASAEFSTSKLSMPIILAAGQGFNLSVTFAPIAVGWVGQNIQITSSGSNIPLNLQVAGTGANSVALLASPASLAFSQTSVGKTTTLPVTITNNRSWEVTVNSIQSSNGEFSASSANLPITLKAGQSFTVNVSFTPQSSGTVGAALAVSPSLDIPLTGTGSNAAGVLALVPAPLNFGNVAVGTTATQTITLSATGASVTVNSASSGNSQFVLDGAYFPFTIPAGQSQSFNVAFTPKSSGELSSSLTFASNASNSSDVETVSGTGTVTSYSVSLSWNSDSQATGYNVYRSTSSNGNYSKINSTLDPTTAYTDSTVSSGTYYYAATAVNSEGKESARSAPPVVAVIP